MNPSHAAVCPHCGSEEVIPHGSARRGTPRLRCQDCGRTFDISAAAEPHPTKRDALPSMAETRRGWGRGAVRPDWLRRWAILANVSLLGLLLLFEGQHRAGRQHFAPLPCVLLLGAICAAALAGGGLAVGRVVRGKGRGRAGGLGLLALLPVILLSLVGGYASQAWNRRSVPHNAAMRIAKGLGASLMEGELAIGGYRRVERARFVMFHRGVAHPEQDADVMDAYLDELERKTNRPIRTPIHWVRGGLLGQGGLAYYGLALGSEESLTEPDGRLKLGETDRHEIAHAVMNQWMPPDVEPPTLLSEGWAEANTRPDLRKAASAYHSKERAEGFPAEGTMLRTLTSPDWYHQDSGFVYYGGYVLTLYLLEEYGAERFFRLYGSIRPHTVESVFQAVYGREMGRIEQEMAQRFARLVKEANTRENNGSRHSRMGK